MTIPEMSTSAGIVASIAGVLMVSWRFMKRASSDGRGRYGVVSRQWLMQHEAEEHR